MPKNNKFYEIKNLAEDTVEIRIYGVITKWAWEEYGEVSSANFAKELDKYKNVSKINLRINSPGGDVFEANAIYNLIKNFSKENDIEVVGYIDGLAASAASFLVLAASKIVMGLGTLFMIHDPWIYASGNATALEKEIEKLNIVKEAILDIYMTKSNKTREEIADLMNKEKWFKPQEALEYGFVDEIIENNNSLENIKNIANEINVTAYINKEVIEEKLKEIRNIENGQRGKIMPKNLQELKAMYPELLNEYEKEIKAELEKDETTKIENAVKAERERIKALEAIPVLNNVQKEVVNKAKYEEAREPKDIMAEFFMSNANKAQAEISTSKKEAEKLGINNITPSVSNEFGDDGTIDAIYNAALQAYNNK